MNFKRLLALLLVAVTAILIVSCGGAGEGDPTPSDYYLERKDSLADRDIAYVTIEVKKLGSIKLALDATAAPITVKHFLRLASEGFYNGMTFFRASETFAIQSGDPNADGTGLYKDKDGRPVYIDGEFADNGYEGNDIQHKRGVIAMLRSDTLYNSASSQFAILNTDALDLDGSFATFGYVVDGMDVVDAISKTGEYADSETGIVAEEVQAKIRRIKVDDLGGIDINEREYLTSDKCEYTDTRDLTGRDILYADITFKEYGTVRLLLDRTTAPITVDHFVALVREGFYDGLTLHRVWSGFMLNGGDPEGDGTGGKLDKNGDPITIKGEFAANGWENDIKHKRGVISMMVQAGDKDSASSQFFICHGSEGMVSGLDGNYAAFGYVVDGMRVLDSIVNSTANDIDSDYMIKNKKQQPVIKSIRIVGDPVKPNYALIISLSAVGAALIAVGAVVTYKVITAKKTAALPEKRKTNSKKK